MGQRRIQKERLELIHTSRALKIVDGSLQAGLTALRRLPEFCQDPGDRVRVGAGVNVALEEFRVGAAEAAAPFRRQLGRGRDSISPKLLPFGLRRPVIERTG